MFTVQRSPVARSAGRRTGGPRAAGTEEAGPEEAGPEEAGPADGRAIRELIEGLVAATADRTILVIIVGEYGQPASLVEGIRHAVASSTSSAPAATPPMAAAAASAAASRVARVARWNTLTAREQAVATHAGRALTNQQIANRLGLSIHTINYHLRSIFRKLRLTSRVQLAHWVRHHVDV